MFVVLWPFVVNMLMPFSKIFDYLFQVPTSIKKLPVAAAKNGPSAPQKKKDDSSDSSDEESDESSDEDVSDGLYGDLLLLV